MEYPLLKTVVHIGTKSALNIARVWWPRSRFYFQAEDMNCTRHLYNKLYIDTLKIKAAAIRFVLAIVDWRTNKSLGQGTKPFYESITYQVKLLVLALVT